MARRANSDERVATLHLNQWKPAYRFYVDRHVTFLDGDEEAHRFFADPSPFYCVASEERLQELERATSGRMLWRRPGRLTTVVVATNLVRIVPR